MFAMKTLDDQENLDNADHLERDYELLGITGVEDMLQDNVKTCISDFMDANIKVWMLTGDKGATAQNIGMSCGILDDSMQAYKVD